MSKYFVNITQVKGNNFFSKVNITFLVRRMDIYKKILMLYYQ